MSWVLACWSSWRLVPPGPPCRRQRLRRGPLTVFPPSSGDEPVEPGSVALSSPVAPSSATLFRPPAVRLLSCPGVDDAVELVRVDRHRCSADRRVGRRDPQPASRGDPSPEAAGDLLGRAVAPFSDRHQALVSRQGCTCDEHQRRREPATDSPSVTRIGNGLDASDQAREIRGVEVDLCHRVRASRICQQGIIERAGQGLGAPPVRRSDVDVSDLAVRDVAAGPTPESSCLTEPEERRGGVTGPEVAGRVHISTRRSLLARRAPSSPRPSSWPWW